MVDPTPVSAAPSPEEVAREQWREMERMAMRICSALGLPAKYEGPLMATLVEELGPFGRGLKAVALSRLREGA